MRLTPASFSSVSEALLELGRSLRRLGQERRGAKWQSVDAPAPMLELLEVSFRVPTPASIPELAHDIKPNLPWADLHFAERVSRRPTNPGTAYKFWPYFKVNKERESEALRHDEAFTHTYQERMWPKTTEARGIHYAPGDLDDVVKFLGEQPETRQAYLPIWFPEDTGVVHRGRVPCTLGYLFQQRGGYLHITYYIRSCDYFRHLRDDIYLAQRLLLWVQDEVDHGWQPGFLNMHISSLHCWASERRLLPE